MAPIADGELAAHSAIRLARIIVSSISFSEDPKTVKIWAQRLGKSEAALRLCCQAAGVRPKDALDLARLLRACSISRSGVQNLYDVLDVLDPRTLRAISLRSGITMASEVFSHCTPADIVNQQTLVRSNEVRAAVLNELSRLVVDSGRGTRQRN